MLLANIPTYPRETNTLTPTHLVVAMALVGGLADALRIASVNAAQARAAGIQHPTLPLASTTTLDLPFPLSQNPLRLKSIEKVTVVRSEFTCIPCFPHVSRFHCPSPGKGCANFGTGYIVAFCNVEESCAVQQARDFFIQPTKHIYQVMLVMDTHHPPQSSAIRAHIQVSLYPRRRILLRLVP